MTFLAYLPRDEWVEISDSFEDGDIYLIGDYLKVRGGY